MHIGRSGTASLVKVINHVSYKHDDLVCHIHAQDPSHYQAFTYWWRLLYWCWRPQNHFQPPQSCRFCQHGLHHATQYQSYWGMRSQHNCMCVLYGRICPWYSFVTSLPQGCLSQQKVRGITLGFRLSNRLPSWWAVLCFRICETSQVILLVDSQMNCWRTKQNCIGR